MAYFSGYTSAVLSLCFQWIIFSNLYRRRRAAEPSRIGFIFFSGCTLKRPSRAPVTVASDISVSGNVCTCPVCLWQFLCLHLISVNNFAIQQCRCYPGGTKIQCAVLLVKAVSISGPEHRLIAERIDHG